MKRWKVILAAALIFTTGVVSGALALKAIQSCGTNSHPGGLGPGLMDPRFDMLGHLRRELDLTSGQSERIKDILSQGRTRFRGAWESCQPKLREEMKWVRENIEAELTAVQRERFKVLFKHTKDRRGQKPNGDSDRKEPPATQREPADSADTGTVQSEAPNAPTLQPITDPP